MNYYSHNIGDYAQATMHLTLIEDAIYSRLLRRYYAEETPIKNDMAQVCRWVGARSEEEKQAVETVLNEFFVLDGDVWTNKRADEEIGIYRAKAKQASAAGKKSAESRRGNKPLNEKPTGEEQNINDRSTTAQRPLNEKPTGAQPNKNQEPRTNTSDTVVSGAEAPVEPAEIIFGRGVPLLTATGVSEKNARSMLGMLRKTHGDEDVIAALQACVDSRAMEPVAYLQGVLRAAKGVTRPRTTRADERANWMASFWQPTQPTMKDMGTIDAAC